MKHPVRTKFISIAVIIVVICNLGVVYYLSQRNQPYTTIGVPGSPGKDAVATNGRDGRDGRNGMNGSDGASGSNGVNGANGINGESGKNGIDGKDGLNGSNGLNGYTPEIRCSNNQLEWKYTTDAIWNYLAQANCAPAGEVVGD